MTQSRTPTCPVPKCPSTISISLAMCRRHWFRVPARLRTALWAAVTPGQLDGTAPPSDTYLEVLRQCLQALHDPVAPVGTRPRRASTGPGGVR
jgi:hypothetical protein